ncbi:MAG: 50S ribosomal protein L18 [Bacteroidia bacterium]|nr:50S ribosomal protein L18 [Bacteroidia bacterium]
MSNKKLARRTRLKRSIAGKITVSAERPRLVVFRSNSEIYAQIIDDLKGITVCSASTLDSELSKVKDTKVAKAAMVGKKIAEKAQASGISKVVFDRNGYLYHGRVKNLADAAREGGLQF